VSGGGSGGMSGGGMTGGMSGGGTTGGMTGGGGGGSGSSACEAQAKACRAPVGVVFSSQFTNLLRNFAAADAALRHLEMVLSGLAPSALQAKASASCNGDPTCLANASASAKASCNSGE
jgi:hypothetical protein